MAKTREELRHEIDELCRDAKAFWDAATRKAKAEEEKIRALNDELELAE